MSQGGCEVSTAMRSSGSSTAAAGSKSGSRVGAAQHGVDEGGGGAEAVGVRELHGLVDGRVRRHAREEAELKQPQPQGEPDGRVELPRLPP